MSRKVTFTPGAGIRHGIQVDALQVYDLVPTILHALKMAVKEPFDGRVAHEIFIEDTRGNEKAGESVVAGRLKRLQVSSRD